MLISLSILARSLLTEAFSRMPRKFLWKPKLLVRSSWLPFVGYFCATFFQLGDLIIAQGVEDH